MAVIVIKTRPLARRIGQGWLGIAVHLLEGTLLREFLGGQVGRAEGRRLLDRTLVHHEPAASRLFGLAEQAHDVWSHLLCAVLRQISARSVVLLGQLQSLQRHVCERLGVLRLRAEVLRQALTALVLRGLFARVQVRVGHDCLL